MSPEGPRKYLPEITGGWFRKFDDDEPEFVIGVKGYDANHITEILKARGYDATLQEVQGLLNE